MTGVVTGLPDASRIIATSTLTRAPGLVDFTQTDRDADDDGGTDTTTLRTELPGLKLALPPVGAAPTIVSTNER